MNADKEGVTGRNALDGRPRWARLYRAGNRRPYGRRIAGLAVVAVLLVMMLLGYGWWVASASSASMPTGDAVVSHAGGQGERLDLALELMSEGAAPTMVLMLGSTRSERAAALCGLTVPYEVLCVDPDPITTEGEARAIADLAEARDWHVVIVVTSDYHLRRAVFLDRRCSGVDVLGAGAEPVGRSGLGRLGVVVEEMLAFPAALFAC